MKKKSFFYDGDKLNKKERLYYYLEKFQGEIISIKIFEKYSFILLSIIMMYICFLNRLRFIRSVVGC